MARVTPCILYFQTTQNLGRVPETLNPQGKLSEKKSARVTPCILYFRSTQNLGSVPTNMFQTRPTHIAAAQEIRTYLQHLALYTHTHTHLHTPAHTHTQLGVLALGLGLWVCSFRGWPGGLREALE